MKCMVFSSTGGCLAVPCLGASQQQVKVLAVPSQCQHLVLPSLLKTVRAMLTCVLDVSFRL